MPAQIYGEDIPMKKIGFTLIILLIISCTIAQANEDKVDNPNKVTAKTLAKTTHSWNKNPLMPYPQGQPQITILRISIPAGAVLPLHTHPFINAGVLIKGELTVVTTAGKTLEMKEGDPIVEVVDTWHHGENRGSETADIIVFYAGIKDQPITLKQ